MGHQSVLLQGVLIRGVPAVLFIEVSSLQGVLIRGVPAVLFIEVSSLQGVLIRERGSCCPGVLTSGVQIRGVPAVCVHVLLQYIDGLCCVSLSYRLCSRSLHHKIYWWVELHNR